MYFCLRLVSDEKVLDTSLEAYIGQGKKLQSKIKIISIAILLFTAIECSQSEPANTDKSSSKINNMLFHLATSLIC